MVVFAHVILSVKRSIFKSTLLPTNCCRHLRNYGLEVGLRLVRASGSFALDPLRYY
jgi:hypothetical protein